MPRNMKKTGAAAVQEAALGHNSKAKDDLTKKYVNYVAEKEAKILALRNEIKEEMVSAREDNLPVRAIRKAAKYLALSQDQRIAQDEEQLETERITKLCEDLPLFSGRAA